MAGLFSLTAMIAPFVHGMLMVLPMAHLCNVPALWVDGVYSMWVPLLFIPLVYSFSIPVSSPQVPFCTSVLANT
jgi:hypothetical protein